jgi:hypothetical protein
MVAMHDGHDHGEGELCHGCRFRKELAEFLAGEASGSEAHWHDTTAEIIELMTMALSSLTTLRVTKFDDHDDDTDNDDAEMAAAAISRLGGAIHELWHVVMDGDAGEPSADV